MTVFETFEAGFQQCFRPEWRGAFLNDCLNRIKDYPRLLDFMFRYVTFNSIFAGGVASLSGKVHVSQNLFRDPEETEVHLADRSAEIASRIFFAAEDEYDARHLGRRITHRTLAQFFLRELLKLGTTGQTATFNGKSLSETDQRLMLEVCKAYQAGVCHDPESLFCAMGFHLASERFADQEFNVIDAHMKNGFPEIVESLNDVAGPAGIKAYYWISAHCSVEVEHSDSAADAIRLAFNYCVNKDNLESLRDAALRGVSEFAGIQETHFSHAISDGRS